MEFSNLMMSNLNQLNTINTNVKPRSPTAKRQSEWDLGQWYESVKYNLVPVSSRFYSPGRLWSWVLSFQQIPTFFLVQTNLSVGCLLRKTSTAQPRNWENPAQLQAVKPIDNVFLLGAWSISLYCIYIFHWHKETLINHHFWISHLLTPTLCCVK